jgi:hypothetical protein
MERDAPTMKTVCLSTSFPSWPLLRQTPAGDGRWGDVRFVPHHDGVACDAWVVYDGLLGPQRAVCPPDNVLFVAAESPAIKTYDRRFLAQFEAVLTCQAEMEHPRPILSQQAQPWMVGVMRPTEAESDDRFGYRQLARPLPAKTRLVSVVCSNKAITPDHRARVRFLEALAARLGPRIDVFGRGHGWVADKWDAIAPYRYHIALENCRVPHYWTEKLADAYLGGAFPIYHGCPNIADYFPADAYAPIDVTDGDAAVAAVERVLEADPAARCEESLARARGLVLDRYNLFPVLADLAAGRGAAAARPVELRPEQSFTNDRHRGLPRLVAKIARLLRRGRPAPAHGEAA